VTPELLAGGGLLRCGGALGSVESVDYLSGAGVVQALPGFAFYGVGIALKVLHVLLEPIVLLLQRLDLPVQRAILCPLLLVGIQPVTADDDVVAEDDRQQNRQGRGDTPPPAVEEVYRPRFQPRFGFAGAHNLIPDRNLLEIYHRREFGPCDDPGRKNSP
jgi:hypothetical protein